MKIYTLYGLIAIEIDDAVSESVVKSIDFQLNYFSCETTDYNENNFKYRIAVKPFASFYREDKKDEIINYTLTGEWGKYYISKDEEFAVEFSENRFNIWCTGSNFLITIFIQLLLQSEEICFIHSAGIVNKKGEAILLSGAGGVGKTAVISEFIKNKGYKLLGDDILAVNSNGLCYPFPRSFIIKEYHESMYPDIFSKYNKSWIQDKLLAIKEFIRLNAPFREIIRKYLIKKRIKDSVMAGWHREPYIAAVPVKEIFGLDSVSSKAGIKCIIDLVRYKGVEFKAEKTNADEAERRIMSVIQFEWLSSYQPVVNMGLFKIEGLFGYLDQLKKTVNGFLKQRDFITIYIPEKAAPDELTVYLSNYLEK